MAIPTLPPHPNRVNDAPAVFDAKAETFDAALDPWGVAVDAVGVQVSADAASASADAASTAADVILTSADAVSTAADVVLTGADAAKAQQWANEPEDSPVEPGLYSAFHWSEKAADSVATLPPGTINDSITSSATAWSSSKIASELSGLSLADSDISAATNGSLPAGTVRSQMAEIDTAKAPLNSPALTGVPTVPTASPGVSTTQVASTAFVDAALSVGGGFKNMQVFTSSGTFSEPAGRYYIEGCGAGGGVPALSTSPFAYRYGLPGGGGGGGFRGFVDTAGSVSVVIGAGSFAGAGGDTEFGLLATGNGGAAASATSPGAGGSATIAGGQAITGQSGGEANGQVSDDGVRGGAGGNSPFVSGGARGRSASINAGAIPLPTSGAGIGGITNTGGGAGGGARTLNTFINGAAGGSGYVIVMW